MTPSVLGHLSKQTSLETVPSMWSSLCTLEILHGGLITQTCSLNGYSHYQQVEDFGQNLVIWFTNKYCPSIKRERESQLEFS